MDGTPKTPPDPPSMPLGKREALQHPFSSDVNAFEPVNYGAGMVRPGQPAVLYDLATVIGAAYQRDIEPTVRDVLPKRHAIQLRPLLHGMPRRASTTGEDGYLDQLFHAARGLDLLQLAAPPGSERALYLPGPRLESWATAHDAEQIGRFLVWWRSTLTWRDTWPVGWPAAGPGPGDRPIYPDTDTRARSALLTTLARCLPDQWYQLDTVLHALWQRRPTDPFERGATPSIASSSGEWGHWRRRHAPRYLSLLGSTLSEAGLVSLASASHATDVPTSAGLLAAGMLPDLVAVTTLGAAALARMDTSEGTTGARDTTDQAEERAFVVQPTFEVVVLRFESADVYRLLRSAEIVRLGPTSTFRFTRQALLRGLAGGEQLDSLLAFLSHRGKKPLSQNVAYTLNDWARTYHEVRLSEVVLLEASGTEAEDALRRAAADLRIDLREVAPGIFAARPAGSRAAFTGALRQRLEAAGVVVRTSLPSNRP